MDARPHRKPCSDAEPELRIGEKYEVPQPLAGKIWTDDQGVTWRRRGQGLLTPKQARKLLARSDVLVMHVYLGAVHEHQGADRAGLTYEIEEYWAGHAQPMAYFDVGEFRNDAHHVMLMIVEGC
jgi:hypothetical protein